MSSDVSRMLGFGCARLYGLPTARQRTDGREYAYQLGVRHFDVAPIYGLRHAERELAKWQRRHLGIMEATKLGITVTPFAHLAGLVQSSVRRALSRAAGTKQRMKNSGGGPSAGAVGRLLYRADDFSRDTARAGLARGLRLFGISKIDSLLLHEPASYLTGGSEPVVAFLEEQREAGRIGSWGLAAEVPSANKRRDPLFTGTQVIQQPYVLGFTDHAPPAVRRIYFDLLSHAFGPVRRRLESHQLLRDRCSELAGVNFDALSDLPGVLIRDTLTSACNAMVFVSSTRPDHLRTITASLDSCVPNEREIVDALRADAKSNRKAA